MVSWATSSLVACASASANCPKARPPAPMATRPRRIERRLATRSKARKMLSVSSWLMGIPFVFGRRKWFGSGELLPQPDELFDDQDCDRRDDEQHRRDGRDRRVETEFAVIVHLKRQ